MDFGVLDTERVLRCESRCCRLSEGGLDKEWVFWSGRKCSWSWCVCSGLGWGILEWVRVFWKGCGCSGLGAGVHVNVRLFWIVCGYCGVGAGILGKVQVFWSSCGCSG